MRKSMPKRIGIYEKMFPKNNATTKSKINDKSIKQLCQIDAKKKHVKCMEHYEKKDTKTAPKIDGKSQKSDKSSCQKRGRNSMSNWMPFRDTREGRDPHAERSFRLML